MQMSKDPQMQALLDYNGHDKEIKSMLNKLKDADVWNGVKNTLKSSRYS